MRNALWTIVCLSVYFLLTSVLSGLRFKASAEPIDISKNSWFAHIVMWYPLQALALHDIRIVHIYDCYAWKKSMLPFPNSGLISGALSKFHFGRSFVMVFLN